MTLTALLLPAASGSAAAWSRDLEPLVRRLNVTWWFGIIVSALLFLLFLAMAVSAVVHALKGKQGWAAVLGGASVATFLTVIIWKPYDRAFEASAKAQQLHLVLAEVSDLLRACDEIADPLERTARIAEIYQHARAETSRVLAPVPTTPTQPASGPDTGGT